jgi:hypothetical protein
MKYSLPFLFFCFPFFIHPDTTAGVRERLYADQQGSKPKRSLDPTLVETAHSTVPVPPDTTTSMTTTANMASVSIGTGSHIPHNLPSVVPGGGVAVQESSMALTTTNSTTKVSAAEADIAAAAKLGKPIADMFPHTTVFFAEIVGFSAWSRYVCYFLRYPVCVCLLAHSSCVRLLFHFHGFEGVGMCVCVFGNFLVVSNSSVFSFLYLLF